MELEDDNDGADDSYWESKEGDGILPLLMGPEIAVVSDSVSNVDGDQAGASNGPTIARGRRHIVHSPSFLDRKAEDFHPSWERQPRDGGGGRRHSFSALDSHIRGFVRI